MAGEGDDDTVWYGNYHTGMVTLEGDLWRCDKWLSREGQAPTDIHADSSIDSFSANSVPAERQSRY